MSNCSEIPIVLFDEDPIFRQALAENLRIDGHAVIECPSANDALVAIRDSAGAALITEYGVMGSRGLSLAGLCRKQPVPPTVVVTAQTMGVAQSCLEASGCRLLIKPINYEQVHELVHDLLRGEPPL